MLGEVEDRALREHDVVVEVLRQPLPQLHRVLVEVGVGGQQVVGAHDGGVASDVAAAEPALLQHGDVGDAVVLGEVVGGGEPMPAARSEEHTSELQSLMRISYAVFCLKKKTTQQKRRVLQTT